MQDGTFTIGVLGNATGTNIETVRYYERIGLLPVPARTGPGNYRTYDRTHLRRLAFIRRARDLSFSIEDIRTLLGLADQPSRPCNEVDDIAAEHLAQVERKIADLLRLRDELQGLVAQCRHGTVPICRILEALAGDNA